MTENKQTLKEIALGDIRHNPLNPRKDFSGPHFYDLVESIRQNGVITPILVRPIEDDPDHKFEIVYGERRYRAMCKISADENAGIETLGDILALVRELDDDTAFDIMTIENLQRNDLTELEEAESFHLYVERRGDDSVEGLAERVGCSPKYIRRRIMVMRLPNYIRKAWGDRVIRFGHLEQLAKVTGDASAVKNVYQMLLDSGKDVVGKMWTVGEFRNRIENTSPLLSWSLFDGEECVTCFNNSSVQKNLFDMGTETVRCTRPRCFREKQSKWLADNWPEFRKEHKTGTNGFRFSELTAFGEWHHCPDQITAECKKCECNVSLLRLSGQIHTRRVCVGDEDCITRQNKVGTTTNSSGSGASSSAGSVVDDGGGSAGNTTEPRVTWHGHHFRQMFYAEQLPIRAADFDPNDTEMLHLYLFLLIRNIEGMSHWLFEHLDIDDGDCWNDKGIFAVIDLLSAEDVLKVMKAASIYALVKDVERESQAEYYGAPRQLFAKHMGIDLAKQWAITQDYVSKKTRDELLDQAEGLGLFDQDEVKQYITETMQKDPAKIRSFKKGEIAKIILESGVKLVGLVPAEVLNGGEG